MTGGIVHVVGAGLAGLAAAVAAAQAGRHVRLYEAAGHAGGRCRSFHDPVLDRLIDNGSHLVLGVNRNALAFAGAIGGLNAMTALPAVITFVHLRQGWRRTITPRHLPVGLTEILRASRPWIGQSVTVTARLGQCSGFADFWHPLCLAILNTPPERASAILFARVLRAILLAGTSGLRGYGFPLGLSAALIDPALARLRHHQAEISFHHRLTGICQSELTFDSKAVALTPADRVVLALPAWAMAKILPLSICFPTETIANIHYRLPQTLGLPAPLGLLGGAGQWLFVRGDVASVTISAAAAAPDPVALWGEIAPLLGLNGPMPPHRVVWERRATLSHRPEIVSRRPGPACGIEGVFLAGDWLASPWPCTIESAISSGLRAARAALGRDDLRFS